MRYIYQLYTMGLCIKSSQVNHQFPMQQIKRQPSINNQPHQSICPIQLAPVIPTTRIITQMQVGNPQQINNGDDNADSKLKMSLKLQALKRLSTIQRRQSNNDDLCDICYEKYNILTKWPMQVCSNQHFICDQCVKDFQQIYRNEPFPCPICRQLIFQYKIKPYQKLFRSLNKLQKIKEEMKSQELSLYFFAFEHQLYEIARAYKDKQQQKLKSLQHLAFQNRNIQTFPYFNRFPQVKYLQLQNNKIANCDFLSSIAQTLKIINLSHNQIQSLDFIDKFQKLQILGCEYNNIKTFTLSTNILGLKQLYLIGNPLQNKADFQRKTFQQLKVLSIQSMNNVIESAYLAQINKQNKLKNAPCLQTLIISNFISSIPINQNNNIQVVIRRNQNKSNNFESQLYLATHLLNYYRYGSIFTFEADESSPLYHQYSFQNKTLTKMTQKFTDINSKMVIPPIGKQTLKLQLNQKNLNVMVGLCTANIKYNSSVYSNQFIGLTFWGVIYNKSEQVPIQCELRLHPASIISMTVDFEKYQICWHIDQRKIGELQGQKYFLQKHQLYFMVGIRDKDVKMEFLS